jgi:hypothetical protein
MKAIKAKGISKSAMGDPALGRISGHANPKIQQFRQVATTAKQTVNFWAFTAVNGDAVVSELHNVDDTSALAYLGNGTAYQNVLYTGIFESITLTSGVVKLELGEQ